MGPRNPRAGSPYSLFISPLGGLTQLLGVVNDVATHLKEPVWFDVVPLGLDGLLEGTHFQSCFFE